ncbi:MAG: hypothetical protein GY866_21050, partial [Proteobacteria bacterium]|nr:hypothetical protein [Pseudomonadota bacterium]
MPRRFSIHRLARYCLHLSEMFKTNRVVPSVIFLTPGGYPEELRLSGDQGEYLTFRFIVNDLKRTPAEKFMNSSNIVARLNLPNMAYDPSRKVEVYASAQDGLLELEQDINNRLKYLEFIDYYAKLSEEELTRYKEEYLPKSSRKEDIMGLRQMFLEEGKREGKREG